jgi:hypothetical protein
MKRGRDQQLKPIEKGASNSFMLGNGGEHLDVNMTMAIVPVSDQIENLGDNLGKHDDILMLTNDDSGDSYKDGDPKGRGSKRFRKADVNDFVDEIEMRSAGSLGEYHREK